MDLSFFLHLIKPAVSEYPEKFDFRIQFSIFELRFDTECDTYETKHDNNR